MLKAHIHKEDCNIRKTKKRSQALFSFCLDNNESKRENGRREERNGKKGLEF
jgi:hypothetical protein